MSRHLSQGRVATLDPMHVSHVTKLREANLDESEGDTRTSHGLKGPRAPKPPQNQVGTRNQHEDPQDSHHTKAHAKVGPQGVGRTDLVSAHPGLPRGDP
jgi:hypothetical protein